MIGRFLLGGTTFLIGAVLPGFLILALWMIGSPPASSVFWTRADVTIADLKTLPDSAGGTASAILLPQVTDPDGQIRTLVLTEATGPGVDAFRERHPVGSGLVVRLSPQGNLAYLTGPGQAWLVSVGVATAFGLLMVFSVLSGLFRKDRRTAR